MCRALLWQDLLPARPLLPHPLPHHPLLSEDWPADRALPPPGRLRQSSGRHLRLSQLAGGLAQPPPRAPLQHQPHLHCVSYNLPHYTVILYSTILNTVPNTVPNTVFYVM